MHDLVLDPGGKEGHAEHDSGVAGPAARHEHPKRRGAAAGFGKALRASPDVVAESDRCVVRVHDDPPLLVHRVAWRVGQLAVVVDDLAHVGALAHDVDQRRQREHVVIVAPLLVHVGVVQPGSSRDDDSGRSSAAGAAIAVRVAAASTVPKGPAEAGILSRQRRVKRTCGPQCRSGRAAWLAGHARCDDGTRGVREWGCARTTQPLQLVYWSNCPAVVMPIRSSSTSAGAGTMAAIATIWAVLRRAGDSAVFRKAQGQRMTSDPSQPIDLAAVAA